MLTRDGLLALREKVRALDTGTGNPRFRQVMNRILDALYPIIHEEKVTQAEWDAAIAFIAGAELPMLRAIGWVLGLSQIVEENNSNIHPPATVDVIEGPFHVPGAPEIAPDGKLHQVDDGGEYLFLEGRVLDTDDRPLAGVTLDVWTTNGKGLYSSFDPDQPQFNCRGKVRTDQKGRYRIFSPMPQSYHMDVMEMGTVLRLMGHQVWRPKHLHFIIEQPGYETLTTQLYFEGDPHNDCDPGVGVKNELIIPWRRHDSPEEMRARNVDRPFITATFDFKLQPKAAEAAA